jgi:hypothetical protein
MNRIVSALTALALVAVAPVFCQTADPSRQEMVRQHSADVMPFGVGISL